MCSATITLAVKCADLKRRNYCGDLQAGKKRELKYADLKKVNSI
jgi:hypothetical protein